MFSMTTAIAADTGVHLGDGSLYIRQNGTDTNYCYSITGNAVEDQLYLLGHVIPTIEAAYNIHKFGIHLAPETTWMSIVYQSKNIALFKHRILGLPNGRKTDLSIPRAIIDDAGLMRCCIREILATDGLLGFYNASKNRSHKYARIQIKMTARKVIDEIARSLRENSGIEASCRFNAEPAELGRRACHILQINRAQDIEIWRREIGFSNPSHISRMLIFEEIGECPPDTSILDRLSYLTGCSTALKASGPLPESALKSAISKMRREFGSPDLDASQIIEQIQTINVRLRRLTRELPRIVDLETVNT
jgi:hypothetical protein